MSMEEAASIAAEYIATLDNLPGEVQHLLTEIKHKEARSQEMQSEIAKESAKYIRHAVRGGLSAKDGALPQKVAADHAAADALAAEKIALAERLLTLLGRARARLDHDLGRVLVLQGDAAAPSVPHAYPAARGPVAQINESLRAAVTLPEALPVQPVAAPAPPAAAPLPKRRRVAAVASTPSIKMPSPAPAVVQPPSTRRAAASARPSPRAQAQAPPPPPEEEAEAEGEEDMGDEGEGDEDKSLYCFCQERSYGEMVACDNPTCRYQWFHLPCVNIKPPLPETWYCSDCIAKGLAGNFAGGGTERSRKRKR